MSIKQLHLAEEYLTLAYTLGQESFKAIYYNAQLNQQQKRYVLALKRYKKALALTCDKHAIADINQRIREIKKIINT